MKPLALLTLCLALLLAGPSGCSRADATASAPHVPAQAPAPLALQVYNPGCKGIFQVASTLVLGQHEAILVDAQFAARDAQQLVQQIRASGRQLKLIYISAGDPDYYFGLATLAQAFPDARILAPAAIVEHIRATQADKLAVWGPKLGDQAPTRIIVPEVLDGDQLELEGQRLQVIGLDGPTPERSFLWIPSLRTVLGGIAVVAGEHVWMADTQTPASHEYWLETLRGIQALRPHRVIPGHFAKGAPQDLAAVAFTADYIRAFDEETANAADAQALAAAMRRRYPTLAGTDSLLLSAKVAKGEMRWP